MVTAVHGIMAAVYAAVALVTAVIDVKLSLCKPPGSEVSGALLAALLVALGALRAVALSTSECATNNGSGVEWALFSSVRTVYSSGCDQPLSWVL